MTQVRFVQCLLTVPMLSLAVLGQSTSRPTTQSAPASATETTEPAREFDTSGFWIFPSPTPLQGSLSTDRPGFSDSYSLVPRGRFHIEGGYSFTYDREQHSRTKNHLLGEWSLRTGITDDFELRIKWGGFSFTDAVYRGESRFSGRSIMIEDHDDGGTDMSIGFKSPLLRQDGWIPNLSIIPAISLPTGANSKSTNDVDPEVRLAWNYALTDKWQVYGVGLAAAVSDSEGTIFQSGASLATYYQFTPELAGFIEYFGLYPSGRGSDCQHNINFGPVILINENFQIDIRAGFGLNEQAPDFFCGIGFGWRF